MSTFKDLVNAITDYEKRMMGTGYHIGDKDIWRDVTFDELVEGIAKYGDPNKKCYAEVVSRIEDYITYVNAGASDLTRLNMMWTALMILDLELGSEIQEAYFGDHTPETLAEKWKIDEEYEAQKEADAEFFNIAKNVLMFDGCLTEAEAEDFLFEMGY